MYQALYRKYRPKNLDEVWGQDIIVKIIKNSITCGKINHAYLFAGPRGTGKTSIAKIFAHLVNCENIQNNRICGKCVSCQQKNNSDIIEIDAASNNGVDEIRELRNKVNLVPSYGKYKIYIIDEVHMLTTGAFNALLKTLEEPPSHIIFILATTDPHKIPQTILSRCQRLDFKKISPNNIVSRLKQITEAEKIEIDEDALLEIANYADGGMRDSIGMLDQAVAYKSGKINIQDIHDLNGTISNKEIEELITTIIDGKLEKMLNKIDYYNDIGKDIVKLLEQIILYLRNMLIYKEVPEWQEENIEYKEIAEKVTVEKIIKIIEILNQSNIEMKNISNKKLAFELALIKIKENITKKQTSVREIKENLPETESPKEKKHELTPLKVSEYKSKINKKQLEEIKKIRIENTLAKFNKQNTKTISNKIQVLNQYLFDPEISKYASIVLDGTLKAASEENLIFVYKSIPTSNIFNENIIEIEKILKKVLDGKYKVISTDLAHWEKIKNEFNSKKRKYQYIEEKIKLEEIILKNEKESELDIFKEIIEYQ